MAVSMNYIPSNVRVPLFYAEVDNSMANNATTAKLSLLIGSKTDGTAKVGVPVLITSEATAWAKFGRGSELALMAEAFIENNTTGELWCLPMAVTGVVSTGTLTLTGTPLESGTIALYIGADKVPVTVAAGAKIADVATDIATAINDDKDLPVSATANTTGETITVTLSCKGVGAYGNDITVAFNRQGSVGGEEDISGLGIEITNMAGGTGLVDYEDAFEAVKAETFYYIGIGDTDATSLDACKAEMQDSTGRWSYARMQYGHVFTAKRGDTETLVTFGKTRNDQHATVFGLEPNNPNPCWAVAAAVLGRASAFLTNDPARPLQTGELNSLLAPQMQDKFGFSDYQTLLSNGIATLYVQTGTVMIQHAITTYRVNKYGDADNSYLDVTTMFTLAEIITRLKTAITSKYPRHKLANNGTRFGAGQAIVTPNVIKSELIAQYASMMRDGLVENADLFAKYLIVERDTNDVNRINVLLPPDLVNQLRIFAVKAQFRLQYSDEA